MVYSRGLYQLARQLISKLFGGKTSGTFRRPPLTSSSKNRSASSSTAKQLEPYDVDTSRPYYMPPGGWEDWQPGKPPLEPLPPIPPLSDGRQHLPPRETLSPDPEVAPPPPEEPYDDIQLLGRDRSYDDSMQRVMDRMRIVQSSNVYGYYYEIETTPERGGILYVTFLAGEGDNRSGPGATYAYYDVPLEKYRRFQNASAISAGNAVWDYLRVRGTVWNHQHRYRLIQVSGDYIPRKATRLGFKTRHLPSPGIGRRSFRRSSLAPRSYYWTSRNRPDPFGDIDLGDFDGGDRE
jgi:hypothetical protein